MTDSPPVTPRLTVEDLPDAELSKAVRWFHAHGLAIVKESWLAEREAAAPAATEAPSCTCHVRFPNCAIHGFISHPCSEEALLAALERLNDGDDGEGCHWCAFSKDHDTDCPVGDLIAALADHASCRCLCHD